MRIPILLVACVPILLTPLSAGAWDPDLCIDDPEFCPPEPEPGSPPPPEGGFIELSIASDKLLQVLAREGETLQTCPAPFEYENVTYLVDDVRFTDPASPSEALGGGLIELRDLDHDGTREVHLRLPLRAALKTPACAEQPGCAPEKIQDLHAWFKLSYKGGKICATPEGLAPPALDTPVISPSKLGMPATATCAPFSTSSLGGLVSGTVTWSGITATSDPGGRFAMRRAYDDAGGVLNQGTFLANPTPGTPSPEPVLVSTLPTDWSAFVDQRFLLRMVSDGIIESTKDLDLIQIGPKDVSVELQEDGDGHPVLKTQIHGLVNKVKFENECEKQDDGSCTKLPNCPSQPNGFCEEIQICPDGMFIDVQLALSLTLEVDGNGGIVGHGKVTVDHDEEDLFACLTLTNPPLAGLPLLTIGETAIAGFLPDVPDVSTGGARLSFNGDQATLRLRNVKIPTIALDPISPLPYLGHAAAAMSIDSLAVAKANALSSPGLPPGMIIGLLVGGDVQIYGPLHGTTTLSAGPVTWGTHGSCDTGFFEGYAGTFAVSGLGLLCGQPEVLGDDVKVFATTKIAGHELSGGKTELPASWWLKMKDDPAYWAKPYDVVVAVQTTRGLHAVTIDAPTEVSQEEQDAYHDSIKWQLSGCLDLTADQVSPFRPGWFNPKWLVDPPYELPSRGARVTFKGRAGFAVVGGGLQTSTRGGTILAGASVGGVIEVELDGRETELTSMPARLSFTVTEQRDGTVALSPLAGQSLLFAVGSSLAELPLDPKGIQLYGSL